MKIKRGTDEYNIPPHSSVSKILCKEADGNSYRLVLIGEHDMRMRRKSPDRPLARPVYGAVYDNKLYLDPKPDQAAVLTVHYYPPETTC